MRKYLMNQPLVPDIEEFTGIVAEIFDALWLTNFGRVHQAFEEKLRTYLGCEFVLPVTNATIGLWVVFKALGIKGEVITTPLTFPATYHVLMNLGDATPVFADVSGEGFCLSPERVRAAITPETTAILAVHAYGFPCDVEGLERLSREFGLRLVYDSAAALGVRYRGRSVVNFGDASVLSFHATKGLSTAEGGAVVCRTREIYERCRLYINFGIRSEEEIEVPGINGKLDEVRSALGLAGLGKVDAGIAKRRIVVQRYLDSFRSARFEGIDVSEGMYDRADLELGYHYFPIVIAPRDGMNRDILYGRLKESGVIARKYYFPTVLDLSFYRREKLRINDCGRAAYLSKNVLCLPVNHYFTDDDCAFIIDTLNETLTQAGVRRHA